MYDTTIENSCNIGSLEAISNNRIYLGGISAMDNNLKIKNSYNAGIMDIQGQASQKGTLYGTFCGTIQNCYALQTNGIELAGSTYDKITTINCATKTAEEMRNLDFVNLLNSSMFKKDSNNINNGYPILNWME